MMWMARSAASRTNIASTGALDNAAARVRADGFDARLRAVVPLTTVLFANIDDQPRNKWLSDVGGAGG